MFVQSLCYYGIICTNVASNRDIVEDPCMDGADIRILAALQNDGRLANNDLAEKVGLSPSQCSRRRAALEDRGVITGYHATLSSDALGLDVLVFVHVTLATHSPDNAQRFLDLVRSIDEDHQAFLLTWEYDYLAKMPVPTTNVWSHHLSAL